MSIFQEQSKASVPGKNDENSHAQLISELDGLGMGGPNVFSENQDLKTQKPLDSQGQANDEDFEMSEIKKQESIVNKLNDDIDKNENALDHSIKTLNESQKFKKMYEMKLQSALMFYDYIVDQNDELATHFLNDPFVDSDLIEKKDKAKKYWNFFSKKQNLKEIQAASKQQTSVIAETKQKADSSSSSSSSSDTDSDSDLDKEEIKKAGKPILMGQNFERDKNWEELLKGLDDETVKQIREDIQLFILQNQDDEKKNCLHFSCKGANKTIFDLIIDISTKLTKSYKNRQLTQKLQDYQKQYKIEKIKDGANIGENVNVLRALMRTHTSSKYIPFYHLCQRDKSLNLHLYNNETKQLKSNFTYMIQQMIELESNFKSDLPKEKQLVSDHDFTCNFIHPDTNYSCLHWLSYWNDNESIQIILNRICNEYKDDPKKLDKNIMRVMSLTKADNTQFGAGRMTPVTIAGEKDNIKSLKVFLDFFKKNHKFIINLFDGDKSFEPNSKKVDNDRQITLKVFSKKEVKAEAYHFVELYYWATFVNDIEIINLFLIGLGFSPLMNIFKGQTPVHATCLMTDNLRQQNISWDLFQYFLNNSSLGLKEFHQSKYLCLMRNKQFEDIDNNRYVFLTEKDRQKFEISRQTVDSQGNSILHYIFDIQLTSCNSLRNKFLRLALKEQIGDIRQRNVENFLPAQIPHRQPIQDIPEDIVHFFPATVQEAAEADYLIVTKKKNQKFVTEQLRQMKLMKHTRFYYIQKEMPHYDSFFERIQNMDFSSQMVDYSLISIKVPPKMLDRVATKEETMAALTNCESSLVVKIPFQIKNRKDYNMFDAREKFNTIETILENQIDFNLMQIQGIIEDHFPLHKRGGPNKALDLYNNHKWGLLLGFLTGNFYEHMYPLNFLKSYYGEKYALQVAFLLHYQAWLIPPTILGILTVIFNFSHYAVHQEDVTDLTDNFGNAVYGLVISIWASLMTESWKNTEKIIAFEWAIEEQALNKDDERVDDFKYNWVFNDNSNVMQKQRLIPKNGEMFISRVGQIISVILTIFVMILYVTFDNTMQLQLQDFKDEVEANPDKFTKQQKDSRFLEIMVLTNVNTGLYSAILIALNLMNGLLSKWVNDKQNYQMQSEYEDGMIDKTFRMGFFNFYFPLFLVAFLHFFKYNDLFGLVVTQLGLKQVAINMIELIMPILFTRSKLKKLEERFQDVINKDLSQFEDLFNQSGRAIETVKTKIEEGAKMIGEGAVKMGQSAAHLSKKQFQVVVPFHRQESSEKTTINNENSLTTRIQQDKSQNIHQKESKKDNKRQNQLTQEELKPIELGGGICYFEDKYKELKNSRFRYYQAIRDYCRYAEKPDILMLYQEVVAQFGFIILFGQIFPLGSLFSMIANNVQIRIQIGHLRITRRWKPEIAISIGKWQQIMEFLSTLSVVTNCAMIYFTHQKLTIHFLGKSPNPDEEIDHSHNESPKWEIIEFFMLLVGVEHLIILIKSLTKFNNPGFIDQGLKDRLAIKDEYKRNLDKKARKRKQKKNASKQLIASVRRSVTIQMQEEEDQTVDPEDLEDQEQQEEEDDLLMEAQNFSIEVGQQSSTQSPEKYSKTGIKSKDLNENDEWLTK